MSVDNFVSTVEIFRRKLELLKETWVELQDCESMGGGDPFIDNAWDEYLTARIDTEAAFTDLVQEMAGFYVLAHIENVHVDGVE